MSYNLKFKIYFVARREKLPTTACVKEHLINSFFLSDSMVEYIEIDDQKMSDEGDNAFLSSMEAMVSFKDSKQMLFNRLKLLNKLGILEKYNNDIKNDGENDYIIVFIGVL